MAVHYRRLENLFAGILAIGHKHTNKAIFLYNSFPVAGKPMSNAEKQR